MRETGPHLYLRKRKKQKDLWVIRTGGRGGREISTGYGAGDRAKAEIVYAEWVIKNQKPDFGSGDPAQVQIGICLTTYAEHRAASMQGKRQRARLASEIERLGDFWASRPVTSVSEKSCADYVGQRCKQTDKRAKRGGRTIAASTAKRELVTLSAALNWCADNPFDDGSPRLLRAPKVHMPAIAERRERWLTRTEVAALLWGALGFAVTWHRPGNGPPTFTVGERNRFRINYHLARFILIGLYTGTRHDAMLRLQWIPNVNGGWFDLDAGILYRRPQDAVETNKRRTPCPIPDRLTPHLRRWRRLTARYAIEHAGQPINSQQRRAWAGARDLAGLGPEVTPHVLKHSCATQLLRAGKSVRLVAGYLGTSEQVIERTYGHHALDEKAATANDVFSRRPVTAAKIRVAK